MSKKIKRIAKLFESSNKTDHDIAFEILEADQELTCLFFSIMFLVGHINPQNREFDEILGIDDNRNLWVNVSTYFENFEKSNNALKTLMKC